MSDVPFYMKPGYKEWREKKREENKEMKLRMQGATDEVIFSELQSALIPYWNQDMFKDNCFLHYIITLDHRYKETVQVIETYCHITEFKCECKGKFSDPHVHMIAISRDNKNPQMRINNRFTYLRRAYGTPVRQSNKSKRTFYSRVINTRVHLVNCILYIQTANVKGMANGSLKASFHYNHTFRYTLRDARHRKLFVRDYLPPQYDDEASTEWEEHSIKTFRKSKGLKPLCKADLDKKVEEARWALSRPSTSKKYVTFKE